jgi:hypothetical protein
MTPAALLTGRTLGDVVTNVVQLIVMISVGLLVGSSNGVGERARTALPGGGLAYVTAAKRPASRANPTVAQAT